MDARRISQYINKNIEGETTSEHNKVDAEVVHRKPSSSLFPL